MIPKLKKSGLLPTGVYPATWKEVEKTFGGTAYRQLLLAGLKRGLSTLHQFGCTEVYIGGSFVTDEPDPGDIDVCYNNTYIDLKKLKNNHPEFFDSKKGTYRQRKKWGCEFYPFNSFDMAIVDFFSFSRKGEPKGLIKLNLEEVFNDKERKAI